MISNLSVNPTWKRMQRSIGWGLVIGVTFQVNLAFSAEPGRKTLQACETKAPIQLDGKLTEAVWREAPLATGFVTISKGEPACEPTTCRVAYDTENLYLGIDCVESRMDLLRAAIRPDNGQLKYEDGETIEIFLDVNHDQKNFLQILVNTNGALETHSTDPLQLGKLPIEARVALRSDGFSMEVRVPFALLHPQPNPTHTLGFNLCRARMIEGSAEKLGPDAVYSSWNPTVGGFRQPERFGDLVLPANLSPYQWTLEEQTDGKDLALKITNQTGQERSLLIETLAEDGPKSNVQQTKLSANQHGDIHLPLKAGQAALEISLKDSRSKQLLYVGNTALREILPVTTTPPPPAQGEATPAYTLFTKHYAERVTSRTEPLPGEIGKPLHLFASQGEYEPVSLAIRARKDFKAVNVELAGDLTGAGGATIPSAQVEIRIVEWTKRWKSPTDYERVECFLIHNRPRSILANTTQRYWLTVHVPPTAKAGRYETKVRVTLDGETTLVPLRVEVLPFTLDRSEGMNYFMYMRPTYLPPGLRTETYWRRVLADMREHGMTTITLYAYPTQDVEHDSVEPLPMRQQMELARETGVLADWAAVPWIGAECFGLETWKFVADAVSQNRWPKLLWYLVDEPGPGRFERVENAMKIVSQFREKFPERPITTTTSGASRPEVSHYYDVWIMAPDTDQAVMAKGRAEGKTLWSYECTLAPVDAQTSRYYFGFWSWKTGVKSASHWSYWDDNMENRFGVKATHRDSENDLREYTHMFNFVYPRSDELIPTIGWEAVREGIDDHRYVQMLERLVAQARQQGGADKQVIQAQALLTRLGATIHPERYERCMSEAKKNPTDTRGQAFDRKAPETETSPAAWDQLRWELAQQIIALLRVVH